VIEQDQPRRIGNHRELAIRYSSRNYVAKPRRCVCEFCANFYEKPVQLPYRGQAHQRRAEVEKTAGSIWVKWEGWRPSHPGTVLKTAVPGRVPSQTACAMRRGDRRRSVHPFLDSSAAERRCAAEEQPSAPTPRTIRIAERGVATAAGTTSWMPSAVRRF
jgi:hypothetical protein